MGSSANIADLLKQAGNGGRENHRRTMWNSVVHSRKRDYNIHETHPNQLEIVKAAATSADAFVEHMTVCIRRECAGETGPTPESLRCLPPLPSGVLDPSSEWPGGLNPVELHRHLCDLGFTRRLAADAWNWFLFILRWTQAEHLGASPAQALIGMPLADIISAIGEVSSNSNEDLKWQIDKMVRPLVRNTGGMHSLRPTAFVHHCPPATAWWQAELAEGAASASEGYLNFETALSLSRQGSIWREWAEAVFLGTPRVAPAVVFAAYLIAAKTLQSEGKPVKARELAAKLARRCRGLHVQGISANELAKLARD